MVNFNNIACALAVAGLASSQSLGGDAPSHTGAPPSGLPSGFPHHSGFPSGVPSGFAHHSGHGHGSRPTVRPSGAPPSAPSPVKRQDSGAPPAFSGMPTVRPTVFPTGMPAGFPSGIPSGFAHHSGHGHGPRVRPSGSGMPSGFPSGVPSGFAHHSGHGHGSRPTVRPSGAPSSAPRPVKRQESVAPPAFSGMPTVRPTGVPSGMPPGFPSGMPSGAPHHSGGFGKGDGHSRGPRPTNFPSGLGALHHAPSGAPPSIPSQAKRQESGAPPAFSGMPTVRPTGARPTGARPTGARPTGVRPTGMPSGAPHHSGGFGKGDGHSRGPRPTNLPSGFGALHPAPSGAPSAMKPSGFVTMRRA
jgi:hypothetical protein